MTANFEKATLVRASLAGSKAEGAKFDRIEAYRANFSGIHAQGRPLPAPRCSARISPMRC